MAESARLSALVLAVLLVGTVFIVPSANPIVAASNAGNTEQVGNNANVANETATSTSTPTSTATPRPTATPTSNTTNASEGGTANTSEENSTAGSQANLSKLTPIIEVARNGSRMMVTLQGTNQINTTDIQNVSVRGASIQKPLSIEDEYPMASGHIDRPTTVRVVVIFHGGTEQEIASEQYNQTAS
jgi:hypothetical protein